MPPYPDSPSRLTTPGSTHRAPQPTNSPLSQAGQDDIHSREGHGVRGRPFPPTRRSSLSAGRGLCAWSGAHGAANVVDPSVRLLDFVHREGADEGWRLSLGGGDADRIRRCRRPCRGSAAGPSRMTQLSSFAARIEVVPTSRTPHVTLAHAELDELLRRLSGCEHEILENSHCGNRSRSVVRAARQSSSSSGPKATFRLRSRSRSTGCSHQGRRAGAGL